METKPTRPGLMRLPAASGAILTHVVGWLPLVWTGFEALNHHLTVNPIQEVEQRLGRYALYFLAASLACTPAYIVFGWREALKRRRALGLYATFYAGLHVFVFLVVDYGLDWGLISETIAEKLFILIGLTAGLILLILAITSFRWWMRVLGKNWKRLHRLVYAAGLLAVLHYALAKKGNITTLSGDILAPLKIGLLVALLLAIRLKVVKRGIYWVRKMLSGRGVVMGSGSFSVRSGR